MHMLLMYVWVCLEIVFMLYFSHFISVIWMMPCRICLRHISGLGIMDLMCYALLFKLLENFATISFSICRKIIYILTSVIITEKPSIIVPHRSFLYDWWLCCDEYINISYVSMYINVLMHINTRVALVLSSVLKHARRLSGVCLAPRHNLVKLSSCAN